ncbi:alkaline shock response membrane anchor protein AmaP [Staphylococcus aureus]
MFFKLTLTKEVSLGVKRLKNFILGLLIVVIVGFLLFMYIQDGRITEYQDYFLQFKWSQPLLISLAALLILIGLILVFSLQTYASKTSGLYKDFDDGHVYVSRKAVEKTAFDTVPKI